MSDILGMVIVLIMIIILGFMTLEDLKAHQVSAYALIIFCLFGFAYALLNGRWLYAVIATAVVIIALLAPENQLIGSADIISLFGIFAILDMVLLPHFMFWASLTAISVFGTEKIFKKTFIQKDGQLAMLPSFFIVFVCFLIAKFLI